MTFGKKLVGMLAFFTGGADAAAPEAQDLPVGLVGGARPKSGAAVS